MKHINLVGKQHRLTGVRPTNRDQRDLMSLFAYFNVIQ
jgi:hypothetical protein